MSIYYSTRAATRFTKSWGGTRGWWSLLLWLTLVPWWRAFRQRRQGAAQRQAMWFAVVASWLPVMALSITQPEIVTPQTVLLMCMGLVIMLARAPARAAPPPLRRA